MFKQILYNSFLTNRFFIVFGSIVGALVLSFLIPFLTNLVWLTLAILVVITLFDGVFLLYSWHKVSCERVLPKVLPLGDEIEAEIKINSQFPYNLDSKIIDELPHDFQDRNFEIEANIPPNGNISAKYLLRPTKRGAFQFGKCNLFVMSQLSLVQLKLVFDLEEEIKVYPSVVQMKKHELAAIKNVAQFQGMKKIRRFGHSYEFEQIKNYVLGDDFRSVNWKATGRTGQLMVNQYGDERSQQIYSIIDRSRVMQMPFNELSLMDYAINSSLVISNIAIKKYDKAGIISFDNKLGSVVKSDNRPNQIKKIIETLYRQKESSFEANYQLLFSACQRIIKQRSLIILYTNFESSYALDRVIPILRKVNRLHLLLLVFFKNSELEAYGEKEGEELIDIYSTTMASKFQLDKKMMLKKLNQYGIQTLLTKPEDLSINVVNNYLEFKAKGWI